jgi:hypothetical protein
VSVGVFVVLELIDKHPETKTTDLSRPSAMVLFFFFGRPDPALLVVGPALFALSANALVLTLPFSGASAVVLTPMLETGPDQYVAQTILDAVPSPVEGTHRSLGTFVTLASIKVLSMSASSLMTMPFICSSRNKRHMPIADHAPEQGAHPVVVFTAVPITKLFAWGEGGSGGMCYEILRAEDCVMGPVRNPVL